MSLRTKLILILTAIVIGAVLTASMILYLAASTELVEKAEHRLRDTAELLAEMAQLHLNADQRKLEYWANTPLVVKTALEYEDPGVRQEFDTYFSAVVDREPYSSIFLLHKNGDCIASEEPKKLFNPHCREVVSKKPTVLAGLAGNGGIGEALLSIASGQPLVTLTAPVRHQGQVTAVLRSGVDMGRLRREVLKTLHFRSKEDVYVFDPSLPKNLPKGFALHAPTTRESYTPPPKELQAALGQRTGPTFRYQKDGKAFLTAFAMMDTPKWFILISQPMSEITRPVKFIKKITLTVMALTCGLIITAILLLTAPVINGIDRCRQFASDIRRGRFDRRLAMRSRDEVGDLARGLNEMADKLQSTLQALQEAEIKYRGIFENAVEGIFQTDESGIMLAANPRLAALLEEPDPGHLTGRSILPFYRETAQRNLLISRLRDEGEVTDFECDLVLRNGATRRVVLHARADLDPQRNIRVIHGSMEDVTEFRLAEAEALRTRKAETQLVRNEIEMLRYQVNPHFLFNTLNSIRELVLTAPDEGVDMIEALAEFYHSCLTRRSKLLSSVAEELDRIQMYLKIQNYRFGSELKVSVDAAREAEFTSVPIFILQPIVENAVKFGRKSGQSPLDIRIRVSVREQVCSVRVDNTGHWFEPAEGPETQGAQLGLEYVRHCLAYHYGEQAGLDIRHDEHLVSVRINFPVQEAT